jgi:VanZ family protein
MAATPISPVPLQWIRFIPALLWWALSFWLLTLPGTKVPAFPWTDNLPLDKLAHVFLFATYCCLFYWPLLNTTILRSARLKWLLVVAVVGVGYGIAMEFVQKYYVINRSFEYGDILADIGGCLLGWWLGKKYAMQ